MCVNKALIVGGGIAGLTAAISMARKGIACDVVEITSSGEPVGAAITISGPAIETLAAVGILDACKELGRANALIGDIYDAAGKPIGDGPPGNREAPAAVSIFRPVLSELLSKQARRHGARLRYSISVKTLVQIDDGVVAEFTDGTKGRYDLVVGADGIRSEVRRLAIADDIQPHHARQTSVRWMAKGPPIDGPHMLYCAPTITLLSIPLPLQNFIYVATVSNGCLTEHVDSDKARAILAEQLAAFTAPYVVELAKRLTPASDVVVRPFEWLLLPYPWFRGRVLLIGDAAHATTPHLAAGGGMAMEDAVVLAECLATAASVKVGLDAFMERRFERVRRVVDSSVAISKLEQEGASPSTIYARRNAAIRQLAEPY